MTRAVIEASQLNEHLRADMPRLAGRAASFCFESASGFYDAFDQGLVFFSQVCIRILSLSLSLSL